MIHELFPIPHSLFPIPLNSRSLDIISFLQIITATNQTKAMKEESSLAEAVREAQG
jgi:hypothetical protein